MRLFSHTCNEVFAFAADASLSEVIPKLAKLLAKVNADSDQDRWEHAIVDGVLAGPNPFSLLGFSSSEEDAVRRVAAVVAYYHEDSKYQHNGDLRRDYGIGPVFISNLNIGYSVLIMGCEAYEGLNTFDYHGSCIY